MNEIEEIIESLNKILSQIQQIEQLLTQALYPYQQKQKQFYAEPS